MGTKNHLLDFWCRWELSHHVRVLVPWGGCVLSLKENQLDASLSRGFGGRTTVVWRTRDAPSSVLVSLSNSYFHLHAFIHSMTCFSVHLDVHDSCFDISCFDYYVYHDGLWFPFHTSWSFLCLSCWLLTRFILHVLTTCLNDSFH